MAGEVIKSFSAPGTATLGLGFDGHFLWLDDSSTGKIYQIDPADGVSHGEISVPGSVSGIDFIGKNLVITYAFVAAELRVIDRLGNEIKSLRSGAGSGKAGVAFNGKHLVVVDGIGGNVTDWYDRDGKQIKQVSLGYAPRGITFDGKYYYICSDTTIYQYDGDFNEIRNFSGPANTMRDLAFDGKNLWLSDATTANHKVYCIHR